MRYFFEKLWTISQLLFTKEYIVITQKKDHYQAIIEMDLEQSIHLTDAVNTSLREQKVHVEAATKIANHL